MNPAGYLVWVRDFACRPMAQWWPTNAQPGDDSDLKGRVVKTTAVAERHAKLPLADLSVLYPLGESVS